MKLIAVNSQLDKFIKAFYDLDSSQLEPLLHKNVTAFFGKGVKTKGGRIEGKKKVMEIFETYFKDKTNPILINPLKKKLTIYGEIAIVTFELQDDNNTDLKRRTFVMKKENEPFLILHIHASNE